MVRYGDDITLYGDNLQDWRDWIVTLENDEPLLRWAIRLRQNAIMLSMPFYLLGRIVGIPMTFITNLTFGIAAIPFKLLESLAMTVVMGTSRHWPQSSSSRPLLLLIGPPAAATAMLIGSIPPAEPDVRETKEVLYQLWPLGQRRLEWIAERGNGAPKTD